MGDTGSCLLPSAEPGGPDTEEVIMEQLRACYKEMSMATDPYPHAAVLANQVDGPGAVFDEMNREFIARGAREFHRGAGDVTSLLFRWRSRLCRPSAQQRGATASEVYRRHYAMFDVTSTSLPATWVRGIMLFFKKQLKQCWLALEQPPQPYTRTGTRTITSSPTAGGPPTTAVTTTTVSVSWSGTTRESSSARSTAEAYLYNNSSRPYYQQHPQGYLSANSVDLLREVVAWHFLESIETTTSRVCVSTSVAGGPATIVSDSTTTTTRAMAIVSRQEFQQALQLMPALVSSFQLAQSFCRDVLVGATSTPSASIGPHTTYPGTYRYPHRNSGHCGAADRLYTDILRSEFGNAEWLRYTLSMLLGSLQLMHQDEYGELLADLPAAKVRAGAAADLPDGGGAPAAMAGPSPSPLRILSSCQQLLEWSTAPETARQFTQLLTLLFIQEQCRRYFPHDYYRSLVVELLQLHHEDNAEVEPAGQPADTGPAELCASTPLQHLTAFLAQHLPQYVAALEPLATATHCTTHYTSVILLQLCCVQYPAAKDLVSPLWTRGISSDMQPCTSPFRQRGGSPRRTAHLQPLPSIPTPTPGLGGAAGNEGLPPIHPELPVEQTFMYHAYTALLQPLLRAHLAAAPPPGSDTGRAILQLAAAAPRFTIPVSTRLLRWRVLQLGDQPTAVFPVGISAFQAAMGAVLHQILEEAKEAMPKVGLPGPGAGSGSEALRPAPPTTVEDQLLWLLGKVVRIDVALWALLREGEAMGPPAATPVCTSPARHAPYDALTALKEGVHHLYAAFRHLLQTISSTAGTLLAVVLANSSHQFLHKEENGSGSARISDILQQHRAPLTSVTAHGLSPRLAAGLRHSSTDGSVPTAVVLPPPTPVRKSEAPGPGPGQPETSTAEGEASGCPGDVSPPVPPTPTKPKRHGRPPVSRRIAKEPAAGRGASGGTGPRRKKKFLGLSISAEEELHALLRLSRCAEVDVFLEKYQELLLARLLFYPDPMKPSLLHSAETASANGARQRQSSMADLRNLLRRTDAEADALKRFWEGKALEYLEEFADTGGPFLSLFRVYQQFSPMYLTYPVRGEASGLAGRHASLSDRGASPVPAQPPASVDIVLSVVDWRQSAALEVDSKQVLAATARTPRTAADAHQPVRRSATGAVLEPLPVPRELAPAAQAFRGDFAAAARHKRDLRFRLHAALSCFTLVFTFPRRAAAVPGATPPPHQLHLTVHAPLLVHRLLLALVACGPAGASFAELTERVNLGLPESTGVPSGAAPPPMEPKQLFDLLRPLIERERVLRLLLPSPTSSYPPPRGGGAPPHMITTHFHIGGGRRRGAKGEDGVSPRPPAPTAAAAEQRVALHYKHFRLLLQSLEPRPESPGMVELEVSHWPRPRLHTTPFEDAHPLHAHQPHVPPQVQAFRQEKVKIHVVQHLKHVRQCSSEALFAAVKESVQQRLGFPVTTNAFKMALEELIQKEMVKRAADQPSTQFLYAA